MERPSKTDIDLDPVERIARGQDAAGQRQAVHGLEETAVRLKVDRATGG